MRLGRLLAFGLLLVASASFLCQAGDPAGTGNQFALMWGTEFSNMYRESSSEGLFTHSKNFLTLEFDHRTASSGPGATKGTPFLRTFIGIRGSFGPKNGTETGPATGGSLPNGTKAIDDYQQLVKSTESFFAGTTVGYAFRISDNTSIGPILGVSWASYPVLQGSSRQDTTRSIPRVGARLEFLFDQERKLSSWSELSYQKDPLFSRPLRFSAIGRVTYQGGAWTVFIEGEINQGINADKNPDRVAIDPSSIRAGIQLHLEQLFDSIGKVFSGGNSSPTPGAEKKPGSGSPS